MHSIANISIIKWLTGLVARDSRECRCILERESHSIDKTTVDSMNYFHRVY